VKGAGTYVDLRLPGLVHAMILRSPHAHARVRRIDTSAASAIPGVVGGAHRRRVNDACGLVPCAASIPDLKAPKHTVWPATASTSSATRWRSSSRRSVRRARRRGSGRRRLRSAAGVTNPEDALKDGAPLDASGSGLQRRVHALGDGGATSTPRSAARSRSSSIASTTAADADADRAARRGRLVSRGRGTLTLWTATQVPHLVRTLLPGMIGIAENKLRIVAPEVGGGFGAKLNLYAEEALCAHLAMRLKVPVKWTESRRENAASTITAATRSVSTRSRSEDGTILGIKARTTADLGSYCQLLTPAGADAHRPGPERLLHASRDQDRSRRRLHEQDVDRCVSRRRPSRRRRI
jgi:carbon-monoxide dehydrogenase large subunit